MDYNIKDQIHQCPRPWGKVGLHKWTITVIQILWGMKDHDDLFLYTKKKKKNRVWYTTKKAIISKIHMNDIETEKNLLIIALIIRIIFCSIKFMIQYGH